MQQPTLGYTTGLYSASWQTGVMAAALAADGILAGIRCGPTQTDVSQPGSGQQGQGTLVVGQTRRRVYVTELSIQLSITAAFTAVQQFGLYLRRYSAANLAGGNTSAPFLESQSTVVASVATAGGPEGGEVRVATTAALTSAGVTLDPVKLPVYGWSAVGPADYLTTILDYHSEPIRLDLGEGLLLANQIVWPLAGTAVINAKIKWEERNY